MSKNLEPSKLQAVERSVQDSVEQVDRLEVALKGILHDIGKISADFQGRIAQQTSSKVSEHENTMDHKADSVESNLHRLAREFHILSSVALYDTEDELTEALLHAREFAGLIQSTRARMADTDGWLHTVSADRHRT